MLKYLAVALVVIGVAIPLHHHNVTTEELKRNELASIQMETRLTQIKIEQKKIADLKALQALEKQKADEEAARVAEEARQAAIKASLAPTDNLCGLVNDYDWNKKVAYAVCMAESSGNANNHNYSDATGDDSWGLFQINLYGNLKYSRPAPDQLRDPHFNVAHAYKMYSGGGWGQWGGYTSGKYLKYL